MTIFIVTVLGSVTSFFLALSQTHQYQAFEVIQIESPRIAEDLASSSVQGSSARRLQLVQQQITTRGGNGGAKLGHGSGGIGKRSCLHDGGSRGDPCCRNAICATFQGFSN